MNIKTLGVICSLLFAATVTQADVNDDVVKIQHQWAKANYDTPENQQEKAFETLVEEAQKLVDLNPDSAEA